MKSPIACLTGFFSVLFIAMSVCPAASAQNAARVTVPFAFVANQKVLPAGCYTVERQSNSYLVLVSCTTGDVVGLMARTTNAYEKIGHSSLVFRVGAKRNRLVQIRYAYSNMQSDLAPPTKAEIEREIATDSQGRTIEISMK